MFLWNVVSWDVQGIHPASSSGEGTFKDDVVTQWIKEHNAWVATAPAGAKTAAVIRNKSAQGRKTLSA